MTSLPRLFVDTSLVPHQPIAASADHVHYLAHVLRRGVGDQLVLFNGIDGEFLADISQISRKHGSFTPTRQLRPQIAPPPLHLLFALLKRDATDLVVRAATELGATRLTPLITERTGAARVNLERLRAIAIEAAEQSEGLTLPRIDPPADLTTLLAQWPPTTPLAAALEREPPRDPADSPQKNAPQALIIGPEGGFSPRELEFLRKSPFIQAVSLGPRILRAETAAIAGLALLQKRYWSND